MSTAEAGAPDSEDAPPVRRWPHVLRLAVFAAFLLTLFYLVAVSRVIDVGRVRDAVAATGPVAPLAYALVAALLAAIFVPGPLLAAGSGFLFGPLVGTFVTLGSTVTTATIAALDPSNSPVASIESISGSFSDQDFTENSSSESTAP